MAKLKVSRGWSFKQQLLTLFYAFKDERTPWYAKVASLSSLVYLLSPADLVPDVIPLAGYIDDVFVVPFMINIATKLLPGDVKRIAAERAAKNSKKLVWLMVLIGLVIVGLLVLLFYLARQAFD